MAVYLAFMDADDDPDDEEAPARLPDNFPEWGGPIPRVGEFVYGADSWWEVIAVAYSSLKGPVATQAIDAWVDVAVREFHGDPREAAPR